MWKKVFALILCGLLTLGCFAGCGEKPAAPETTETTVPTPTQSPEEAKVLKVLTLGHSLAVDAAHMLNLVAHAEGYQEMRIGTLYYSGCPLYKHVEFLTNDSREYNLYVSSTLTPNEPPQVMNDVTMGEAIKFDYWDIIVMQGGVFEIAAADTYKIGHIQTIQKYVNDNKLNPSAEFVWNMAWAPPVDDTLRNMYTYSPNSYINNYAQYGHDRAKMYNSIAACVKDYILTDDTFVNMIPSGTVMENALSSYLEEKDIHRDYVHASDLTRLMVAYTWYCTLTGVEQLEEIKLDTVPRAFFKSTQLPTDWVLTDGEKALILECVNNALKNPLQMTQSQYTQAPA